MFCTLISAKDDADAACDHMRLGLGWMKLNHKIKHIFTAMGTHEKEVGEGEGVVLYMHIPMYKQQCGSYLSPFQLLAANCQSSSLSGDLFVLVG